MNWSSNKGRTTAKNIMKVLAHRRAGINQLQHNLEELREEGEPIYETRSKVKETIKEIVEDESYPVQKKKGTGLYERRDINYEKPEKKEVAA